VHDYKWFLYVSGTATQTTGEIQACVCGITGSTRPTDTTVTTGLNYNANSSGQSFDYGTATDNDVVIPHYHRPDTSSDFKPVTEIAGNAFQGQGTSITSINIPASVTSIGDLAFHGCNFLTDVTFAADSQLLTINQYAFSGCTSLENITIPARVTSIGFFAFFDCTNLESVTFERNGNTDITNVVTFPGDLVTASGGIGNQNRFGTWTTINPGTSPNWTKVP
jgi:hypothetical protein